MTNIFKYLYTYVLCQSNRKVITIDGSLNTMVDKGDIKFSPTFILKNILHIRKLCTNLVLITITIFELQGHIQFFSF